MSQTPAQHIVGSSYSNSIDVTILTNLQHKIRTHLHTNLYITSLQLLHIFFYIVEQVEHFGTPKGLLVLVSHPLLGHPQSGKYRLVLHIVLCL